MSILGLPRGAAAYVNVAGLGAAQQARLSGLKGAAVEALARGRWVAGQVVLFAGPVLAVCFFVRASLDHALATDFMDAYLHGARDVWGGRSPYHYADIESGTAFLYPPLSAYAVAPFLALPRVATEIVVSALGAAACFGALWAGGVRGKRCYLLAFGSPVMFFTIQSGNLSALVTLGAALLWRYRGKRLTPVAAGLLVALKLYAWPVLLFYLATRRIGAFLIAAASALAAIFLPWAAIGFAGLGSYPGMLSARTQVQEGTSYTVGALVANLAPWSVAHAITYLLAGLVAIWMVRGRSEAQIFCATLGLTVLLSPLALYDYFGLIFVVLGIRRRVGGWQWSAPSVLWLAPAIGQPAIWQLVLVLAIVGSILVSATRAEDPATQLEAVDDAQQRAPSRSRPLRLDEVAAVGSVG